jgi:hypothetical protein
LKNQSAKTLAFLSDQEDNHSYKARGRLSPTQTKDTIMAKTISIADALSTLAAAGIELGAEHADAIAELTRSAYLSRAVEVIGGNGENLPGKLVGYKGSMTAEDWAGRLFDFAELFANDFAGEAKNVQGGAVRMVRVVGIDTPHGHLKVELRSE